MTHMHTPIYAHILRSPSYFSPHHNKGEIELKTGSSFYGDLLNILIGEALGISDCHKYLFLLNSTFSNYIQICVS